MILFFPKAKLFIVPVMATIILSTPCTHKKQEQPLTWLYGYGQVEKINGRVKKLTDLPWGHSKTAPYWVYTFEKKGNVVIIEDVFQNGIDTAKYNTVYNKNGKKTEAIGLYVDGDKPIKEVYEYDDYEHMTRFIGNANNTSADTNRFFYDNTGNITAQHEYFEKKPLWKFKFKYLYNKNGVCVDLEQSTTTWHDHFKTPDKDTTRYVVLDSKNNWLKAVRNGDTLTRKITYY